MENVDLGQTGRMLGGVDSVDLLPVSDFFTRGAALALGGSDRALRTAVRDGHLVRLRQGAYARRELVDSLDDEARHLLLARAVLPYQRGEVALAGPTAALWHGYAVYGLDLSLVHLVRLDDGASRRETGIVHRRASEGVKDRVVTRNGVLVVSPVDAAWQTALVSTLEGGVVTLDSALHRDPTLRTQLAEVAAGSLQVAGSRTARMALRLARHEAESPGESLTRVACYRHGIPAPDLQHDVFNHRGRFLGRTDFWWDAFRLLGEFDGRVKYERLRRRGESASNVVVREKRREDRMRATTSGMARFTWSEVQPGVAARRMQMLHHELEQSARLYVSVSR